MHLQRNPAFEEVEFLQVVTATGPQMEAPVAPAQRLLDPCPVLHFLIRAGVDELVGPKDAVGMIAKIIEDPFWMG